VAKSTGRSSARSEGKAANGKGQDTAADWTGAKLRGEPARDALIKVSHSAGVDCSRVALTAATCDRRTAQRPVVVMFLFYCSLGRRWSDFITSLTSSKSALQAQEALYPHCNRDGHHASTPW